MAFYCDMLSASVAPTVHVCAGRMSGYVQHISSISWVGAFTWKCAVHGVLVHIREFQYAARFVSHVMSVFY